jgi:imidazole glycerol phosphate synthase subunit HisF
MAKKSKNKKVVDGKDQNPIEVSEEAVEQVKETVKITKNVHGGKYNVKSIDELLGRTSNPYSVGTEAEYEASLKKLTLADLQSHATRVGLLPVSNNKVLISRLMDLYRKTARGYYNTLQVNVIEPKNKERLLEILKRGAN